MLMSVLYNGVVSLFVRFLTDFGVLSKFSSCYAIVHVSLIKRTSPSKMQKIPLIRSP